MDIKIICDSLCDIPDEISAKEYLEVIPLTLIMDGKEYRDGIDITKEEFYDMVSKTNEIPKTSQATYMQFKEVFDKYISEGKKIICMTGSSTATGTFQSATLAKGDTEGEIYLFDTKQLSLGAGQLVVRTSQMLEEGMSYEEIKENLENIKDSAQILFAPASFDFLKKSGRVPLTTAVIGNMLNIKPIFKMAMGEINLDAKVRGVKKLVTKMVDLVDERIGSDPSDVTILIGRGSNEENFLKLKEEVEARLKDKVKKIYSVKGGACVCSHTGPDIIAISFSK
ncbi:DegV family protein [Peptostreptococcus faecalis]|uniref:DegV family protein n=1 Tax=Peptostreptococcus faecalis TaxID=2045015 RepID=UPI000C7DA28A|nr:DegV family protein [Peptostreptococcus faecalis]